MDMGAATEQIPSIDKRSSAKKLPPCLRIIVFLPAFEKNIGNSLYNNKKTKNNMIFSYVTILLVQCICSQSVFKPILMLPSVFSFASDPDIEQFQT